MREFEQCIENQKQQRRLQNCNVRTEKVEQNKILERCGNRRLVAWEQQKVAAALAVAIGRRRQIVAAHERLRFVH
jgi:hypothetical protein